jgi:hypothetical protein
VFPLHWGAVLVDASEGGLQELHIGVGGLHAEKAMDIANPSPQAITSPLLFTHTS